MKIKNLVTSHELSKRLSEAGWEGETYFHWVKHIHVDNPWWGLYGHGTFMSDHIEDDPFLPAPTTSELLEVLPAIMEFKGKRLASYLDPEEDYCEWLSVDKNSGDKGGYDAYYGDDGVSYINYNYHADTPAEALGELWLDLRKNNLV